MNTIKGQNLCRLFKEWCGDDALEYIPLPQSGSYREYYRIKSEDYTAIGVFNADKKENIAFITFTNHFLANDIKAPQIYKAELDKDIYLIQDLGDVTLHSMVADLPPEKRFSLSYIDLYKQVIDQMPKFQILAAKSLDYSVCYPRDSFDKRSMMWDLSYFKYHFLKLVKIHFDEQLLEDDFNTFTDYLLQADSEYFLYRDFQSRNIMIIDNEPYFIDYQGGRKGALQYDLASLLYDAKAEMPQDVRDFLLDYYIKTVSKYTIIDANKFKEYFYGYTLIRILQAMGAYGFRGLYEKKDLFVQSIPIAVRDLQWLIRNLDKEFLLKVPALINVLEELTVSEELQKIIRPKNVLTVTINSFSYKKGIPEDKSGNGGGFVFDCRSLVNPAKYEEYRNLTGKDQKVIDFFAKETELKEYINSVYFLISKSIANYQNRSFNSLMVNFGCTGGQHRSVYCTEQLAARIKEKYDVEIVVNHTNL